MARFGSFGSSAVSRHVRSKKNTGALFGYVINLDPMEFQDSCFSARRLPLGSKDSRFPGRTLLRISGAFLVVAALAAAPLGAFGAPKKKTTPKAFDPARQSTRDLANEEARKCDTNRNGRIEGLELRALNAAYSTNPKSWLHLFDDNGDKVISDGEAARIAVPPPVSEVPSPPPPQDATRPNQAKPAGKPAPVVKGTGNSKDIKPSKAPVPEKPGARHVALQEARKHDLDHNGRIDFLEGATLRAAFAAAPKGSLSVFDEDGDRSLSLFELSKIALPKGASPTQPPVNRNNVAAGKQQKVPRKQRTPKAFDPAKLSTRDLAFEEARKCDANRNGRIDFQEGTALRAAYAADPKSWLSLFDENGDRILDDSELAKIVIPPPAPAHGTAVPKK